MTSALAVAIIHGIGSQKPGFSRDLQNRLRRRLGSTVADTVAMEEIHWADILIERQDDYLRAIKRRTRFDGIREFVLRNLSDAVAYRKTPDHSDRTYQRVHERVRAAIHALRLRSAPDAPLIVLAHSLGGHVMSNYIYDTMKFPDHAKPPFENLRTMGGFVTFGCNIPLFVFSYPPEDVVPIDYPGVDLPPEKQIDPWWLNFYDKDDILGYPLAQIGPQYQAMKDHGELKETPINAGNLLTSWNPLSHEGYWRDDDFVTPVARFIRRFL